MLTGDKQNEKSPVTITNFRNLEVVNGEIVLFSEDLVSHLMNKIAWKSTPYSSVNVAPKMGKYRYIFYTGFTDAVRRAVDVLHDSLSCSIKSKFNDIKGVNNNASYKPLEMFERSVWEKYFSDGIDAFCFLRYCVLLAGLAGEFYRNGDKRAPDFVVDFIANRFPQDESLQVTWDILNKVAERFVKEKTDESKSNFLDDLKRSCEPNENECLEWDSSLNSKCRCFDIELKGGSFEEVYTKRDLELDVHNSKCVWGGRNTISWTEEASKPVPSTEESGPWQDNYSDRRSGMSALLKIAAAAAPTERSNDVVEDQQIPDIFTRSLMSSLTDRLMLDGLHDSLQLPEMNFPIDLKENDIADLFSLDLNKSDQITESIIRFQVKSFFQKHKSSDNSEVHTEDIWNILSPKIQMSEIKDISLRELLLNSSVRDFEDTFPPFSDFRYSPSSSIEAEIGSPDQISSAETSDQETELSIDPEINFLGSSSVEIARHLKKLELLSKRTPSFPNRSSSTHSEGLDLHPQDKPSAESQSSEDFDDLGLPTLENPRIRRYSSEHSEQKEESLDEKISSSVSSSEFPELVWSDSSSESEFF